MLTQALQQQRLQLPQATLHAAASALRRCCSVG
jgi:hypothetical protein